ncbi:hypothetical protein T12_8483 [Trichinella patagoniensis]|uniref:Uncharacterized protein n=1 Tax=Trichinella patagoniensis TaxID=990121 RepID=A0A0V0Z8H1_9BILA|nr:hypothetical protein T12_8483 [Trichinella patagoniensis]
MNNGTSDAEDEELATPSAARLLLYSYVQRNTCSVLDVQGNTTQYLEKVWLATPSAARLLLYSYVQRNTCSVLDVQGNTTQYLEKVWFDYCSVHVSTVISHVSQQFRFLVFFIVTNFA